MNHQIKVAPLELMVYPGPKLDTVNLSKAEHALKLTPVYSGQEVLCQNISFLVAVSKT